MSKIKIKNFGPIKEGYLLRTKSLTFILVMLLSTYVDIGIKVTMTSLWRHLYPLQLALEGLLSLALCLFLLLETVSLLFQP